MVIQILYEGTDITEVTNITRCVCRDVSHGRADSLELQFDHAAIWHLWAPKEDDKIIVNSDGYTTGTMYLNAIMPEGDGFRILATALPSAARRKAWDTYQNMTLENIVGRCAAEAGMSAKLYGADGNLKYRYLMRENEGAAAFLEWLGTLEGLAVKAVHGAFRGISIDYAQKRDPVECLYIDEANEGAQYTRKEIYKISTLTVLSPYARVSASDSNAAYGSQRIVNLPAMDAVQAGRWARGLLMAHNRKAETLSINSAFNPKMEALMRVDVEGTEDSKGSWIVDEVQHDLIERTSSTRLLRVTDSIR